MTFYTIKPAVKTVETGLVFPQIQKMKPEYNYESPNSVYALDRRTTEFPDFVPDLDYFILHNKAKLTDILSTSVINSNGFLVSENFKNLVKNFNISSHRFYEAKVYHKKKLYLYYWLHIIGGMNAFIDYKKSTFFVYHNFSHNLGYITIDSLEDYIIKKEKLKKDNPTKTVTIWAEKICLNENFDTTLDFFKIGMFNNQYFISERLKLKLIENNITGIIINENNVLI